MSKLITTTEELRAVVKVAASIPEASWHPFLEPAIERFLRPYLGDALISDLELCATGMLPDGMAEAQKSALATLIPEIRKPLGPFLMWLGAPELGINVGDTGHTVTKIADKFVPASDAKIAAYRAGLLDRGWNALEALIRHLERNKEKFPQWTSSRVYSLRRSNYLNSAEDFQDRGEVNIGYSRLTFEALRCVMSAIEARFVSKILGRTLDTLLRAALPEIDAMTTDRDITVGGTIIPAVRVPVYRETARLVRLFVANQTASMPFQASTEGQYTPVILSVVGNASEFASFYLSELQNYLNDQSAHLGIQSSSGRLDYNTADKKMFVA